MIINPESPLNKKVLQYLGRGEKAERLLLASPDNVTDPYMGQGSHPDIVQRVWNEIGGGLPIDCRCLIYGTPALIHPGSGIVLLFVMGHNTTFGLHRMTFGMRSLKALRHAHGGQVAKRWIR